MAVRELDVPANEWSVTFKYIFRANRKAWLTQLMARRPTKVAAASRLAESPSALPGSTLIANRERTHFTRDSLQQLQDLRIIAHTGNHAYHIDLATAEEFRIIVAKPAGGFVEAQGSLQLGVTHLLIMANTRMGKTKFKKGASAVTSYERYAVFLAVMQVLVSGLGFIVVAWSLHVLIKTLDAQSSAGVAARQLEFDRTILTYPALYRYFYEGYELARDDPEYARAMAAAQLLANYFDGYFRQQGMYRQMWPDEQWKRYIQDHISKSSVLRSYVNAKPAWFSPEFVKMCEAVGRPRVTAKKPRREAGG